MRGRILFLSFDIFGGLTVCVTRWWVGRDNATLTEPIPSHANCLKMRRLPPLGCTLCWVPDELKTHLIFKSILPAMLDSVWIYIHEVVCFYSPLRAMFW